ncbi:MAG: tetratricopeptide repeat protein [Xanthomonadaceae bacterium]|nr:tetratricopeptide repeat protein [Xanthomonadaceae bacterium]
MNATDEETVENLRKWWSENGPWIIGGLALGALVLFGWRYWNEWRENQLAHASNSYRELVAEAERGDLPHAAGIANELRERRLAGPYVDFAALALAHHALAQGEVEAARAELEGLLAQSSDVHTLTLARLRLARIELADGAFDRAAQLLDTQDTGSFAPLYAELRGDLAAARGDTAAAAVAYREALASTAEGVADRALIRIKLDNLGASAPAQEA